MEWWGLFQYKYFQLPETENLINSSINKGRVYIYSTIRIPWKDSPQMAQWPNDVLKNTGSFYLSTLALSG